MEMITVSVQICYNSPHSSGDREIPSPHTSQAIWADNECKLILLLLVLRTTV